MPDTILRKLREKAGLSVNSLAKLSGVNKSSVSRLDTGLKSAESSSAKTIAALASALGVTSETLLGRKNNMATANFVKLVQSLSAHDKASLRKAAGKTPDDVSASTLVLLYSLLPGKVPDPELWRYMLAAAVEAGNREDQETYPLAAALAKAYPDPDGKKRMENRVAHFLDVTTWDDNDDAALSLLNTLIRMAQQSGYNVDAKELLDDLLAWDDNSHRVQRKWARQLAEHPENVPETDND